MSAKKFPHEQLMSKHNLSREKLPLEAQNFIKDFNKTMNMVNIRGGVEQAKDDTVQKLNRLDKVICDCIFDYLEEQEEWGNKNNPPLNNPKNDNLVPTNNEPPKNDPPTPPASEHPKNDNPVPPVNEPPKNDNPAPEKKEIPLGLGFYKW